jgi:cytochrome oxidase Cu insertion factor (SCO1/SenC/PrrC family)
LSGGRGSDQHTPAVLRAYPDRLIAVIGLTGSDDISHGRRGGCWATPDSDHEHTDVIHGTRVYLIDPAGMLVTSYALSVPKEDMLSDIRAILMS